MKRFAIGIIILALLILGSVALLKQESTSSQEHEQWRTVKLLGSKAAYENFLKTYPESFYRDALVIAYPVEEFSTSSPAPQKITANGNPVNTDLLLDSDLESGIDVPGNYKRKEAVIEIEYAQSETVQSATVFIQHLPSDFMRGKLKPTLQVLADNQQWQTITEISLGSVPSTVSFAPVTSNRFRLLFTREKPSGMFQFSPAPGMDPSALFGLGVDSDSKPLLTELRLSTKPRINEFEVKAGFRLVDNYHNLEQPVDTDPVGINPGSVTDLSAHMDKDGALSWNAPAGRWKILRLGYSLTGKTNSPATDEATGLEVDKYDAEAVSRYLNHYVGMYRSIVGDELIGKNGLGALLTDSTEVGPANWTAKLPEKFQNLRGYDLVQWLPALTGEIVGSRQQSDQFLYDFRRTLGQLNASEHYGTVAKVAHENGLTVYGESLEANRLVSTLGDDMEMRRFADIPMAAMWTYKSGTAPTENYVADMRGAASVAHLYGKKYVAAESLTSILSPWAHSPAELQPMIDAEFLNGINRPVIHTSPHQPVDDKVPGLSLHVFGQYFTRHETWAEMAGPWVDYISRNSFMLQQGKNVADVAYFYGEEPPISIIAATEGLPKDLPTHHAYDFISPDAVLNELSVDKGDLVTRGGARYKVLYLGGSSRDFMMLPILERIAELVSQGATLVGLAPNAAPSLGDDKQAFENLVAKLWSGAGGQPAANQVVEKGRVIASNKIEEALAELKLGADFEVSEKRQVPGSVEFVHRKVVDGDIYFVANRGEARTIDAHFRVTGKSPEIFRADTGSIEPASYRIANNRTTVPLSLGAWESLFVVFREPARVESRELVPVEWSNALSIESPWTVHFQAERGAPQQIVLDRLISLSEHSVPGVRYFSGVASYTNHFNWAGTEGGKKPVLLDLGSVGDLAEVYSNDQYAGTAWKAPYHVDIGKRLISGDNTIEIRVANRWVNRLIGDRQKDAEKITYTTFNTYLPKAPLQPAGLMGPVKVLIAQ